MNYLAVEVDIDHGHVSPKGAEALPEKASGLLIVIDEAPLTQPRPSGLAKGQFTVPDGFNAPCQRNSSRSNASNISSRRCPWMKPLSRN